MASPADFEELLRDRWAFLQGFEEELAGRVPVICTDLSNAGGRITTPLSLQHVGRDITEVAKADWVGTEGLDTVLAYLGELADFWEALFQRHAEAVEVFSAAEETPYCLFLRSFKGVTEAIEVPGARVTTYLNQPELDANFAATLMAEADWLNPVTCMHTDDMQLLARLGPAMPAFRVLTVDWREILHDAIASSGLIVLYVDGDSPGVLFELDCIREAGLESQTLLVYRGEKVPDVARELRFAAVMDVHDFLDATPGETGPAPLDPDAEELLRGLVSSASVRTEASAALESIRCRIVDSWVPAGFDAADPETSYFVTDSNADAFVEYVTELPDSLLSWNAISQDMRLRGIQPSRDDFNALYVSLRMAFASAACLGFSASVAATTGLLAKVASMAKLDASENAQRVERYLGILDLARRFDALTEEGAWTEKIEAFRSSILEDPFM